MRFYKLRVTPDAAIKAASFNEQLKPELIPEQNDPFCVDWIHDVAGEPYYVGEKVRRWLFLSEGFFDSCAFGRY
jgi:actin-related protein 8